VSRSEVTAGRLRQFLRWLSPDPVCAGIRYNELHAGLLRSFAHRGCAEPQHWADVTLDRVIRKIETVVPGYEGDPVSYMYGVARKVFLEYTRSHARFVALPALELRAQERSPEEDGMEERRLACLEQCLAELTPEEREIILLYYQGDRGDKIARRRQMACEASISRDALRKRSQRIRARVKQQLLVLLGEESRSEH
jgi:RNA polymerase sigma factor (sigma-70 family)